MLRSITVTGLLLSLASFARAQSTQPICIIDGVRHPSTDCTSGLGRDDPLYVVDGVIVASPGAAQEATRAKMFAQNIESVEVIKGAAAMAIYGADAANGVIVIKTKTGAAAQPAAAADPLARFLFPPELVMANQQAINLTGAQRSAIQEAMKDAQGKMVDLQFKMSSEVEKLQSLIQGVSVDQAKVIEQADRVLTIEREVKHAQLTLMVRVKNALTEIQQKQLTKLRAAGAD